MLDRLLHPRLVAALGRRPVVTVVGPRQSGKTTLVRAVSEDRFRYLTLDDSTVAAAALADPAGFLAATPAPLAIDEIQRAPELLRAIKVAVDADRKPGRYLLTGSANVLTLPRTAESLAGRMAVLRLLPLTQAERERTAGGFVDAAFGGESAWSPVQDVRGESVAATTARMLRGGYPEAAAIDDDDERSDWFRDYETTLVQKDIRDVGRIEDALAVPRLLRVLAARTARPANFADVARDVSLAHMTLRRYVGHLRALFLVGEIPAWSTNTAKRYAKAPKLYIPDSGLAAHLLQASAERVAGDPSLRGSLFETFALAEIDRLGETSDARPVLHYYRTHGGDEVDLVLEDRRGKVVGIEVTSSSQVGERDLRGLRALAEDAGKRFHRGIVLHTGRETIAFTPTLAAVPITALWRI